MIQHLWPPRSPLLRRDGRVCPGHSAYEGKRPCLPERDHWVTALRAGPVMTASGIAASHQNPFPMPPAASKRADK